MQLAYVHFDKLRALVIDDIGAMRHAMRNQLQLFGLNQVWVASTAEDALRMIDSTEYDLILCDYNLNKANSGQHFLEFLRHEKRLKPTTIFVMITAESEYDYVATAAEYIPDDYILKPCPEKKLHSRLMRLFDRRAHLMPVLEAIGSGDFQKVVADCDKLIAAKDNSVWLMDILRRKAEAQGELGDHEGAMQTYTRALSVRDDLPWAMLGLARSRYAMGNLLEARLVAANLVKNNQSYVAAYELLSRISMDEGEEKEALDLMQRSSKILPSARRFRSISETAYLAGELHAAKSASEEAMRLSKGTITERSEDHLSLAQIEVDLGNPGGAISGLENDARKFRDSGAYGAAKSAILAQAYHDAGNEEKARKMIERALSLLPKDADGMILASLGKAMLKTGDMISGLKFLTMAAQEDQGKRMARHIAKAMTDTGHGDKVEDVIDGGKKRILNLVGEANKSMRSAKFDEAHEILTKAFDIHAQNIEALLAATQLHLLWLRQEGVKEDIAGRVKSYLSTLDRLIPNNDKVMNFYRFYREMVKES